MNLNFTLIEKIMIIVIVGVLMFTFTKEKNAPSPSTAKEKFTSTTTQSEQSPQIIDLGMTLENFCEKYNVAILNVDSRLKQCTINPAQEKISIKGNTKTFLHFFPEGVNMSGEIDAKTNKLTKLEIGCDVYKSRITEWLHSAIYDAAIATVSPKLTSKERVAIIENVDYVTYTQKSRPIIVDEITFQTTRYKGLITSTIEPLN